MKTIPVEEIATRAIAMHDHVHGLAPEIQSAIIAHLLATWIAGHRSTDGDAAKLAAFREELLQNHFKLVRDLIPTEDARLEEQEAQEAT